MARESQGTFGFMSSTLIPVKHPDFGRHSRPFQAGSRVRSMPEAVLQHLEGANVWRKTPWVL